MADPEQSLTFQPDSCRSCGAGLDRRARFCSVCGTSVIPGESPAAAAGIRDLTDVEYMGFWIRLAAELIDQAIIVLAILLLVLITNLTQFAWVLAVPVIIYFVYKHLKCQTPGRKLLKIKVVNAKGEDVGFWRGAFRETIAKFVSAIFFYLGFLWVGWDKRKRGWHDHLAGTFVVRAQPNRPTSPQKSRRKIRRDSHRTCEGLN